jgi:hypothetical protein
MPGWTARGAGTPGRGRAFLSSLVILGLMLLGGCSAKAAGFDQGRAIEVPKSWRVGASGTGGGNDFEFAYHEWNFWYGAVKEPVEQLRNTYNEALQKAGWAWHSSCYTKHEYLSDIEHGCWQKKAYLLVYRVDEGPNAGSRHVYATMYQDK